MTIQASIIGASFITVMVNGNAEVVSNDHVNYKEIRDALRVKDYVRAETLINTAKAVENFGNGLVKVVNEQVFYDGNEVKGSVVNRILAMIKEGFDSTPMQNFLAKLMSNPSKRAVDELYGFLEATALPITEDGDFLAYKKVRHDYKDFYTGTMDNSVGKTLKMVRNAVDDNKDKTCSYGLHFCSQSYLPQYHGGDGRVVIVKINPANVVSIPSDYDNAKGRACEYVVVADHSGGENKEAFNKPVYKNDGVTPVEVQNTVSNAVNNLAKVKSNPSLAGYNRGRSDGSKGVTRSTTDFGGFSGADADKWVTAYDKGYASVSKSDLDKGYEAGRVKGEQDTADLEPYNSYAPPGHTDEYNEGFEIGYVDYYTLNFADLGRNQGYDAAAAKQPYDDSFGSKFSAESNKEFRYGYAEGWNEAILDAIDEKLDSLKNKDLNTEDNFTQDYEMGYADGERRAEQDNANFDSHDNTPPEGKSDSYNDGYVDGYDETYNVDWSEVGYEYGYNDAKNGKPYDDSTRSENGYREGYANGWYDQKLSSL